MATKKVRGTKRTCQNPECGQRFYDLESDPIVCPICETPYVVAHSSTPIAAKKEAKPPVNDPSAEDAEEKDDAEDELVEAGADDVASDDDDSDDDAFLPDDEEEGDGDVKGIIGGDKPGKDGDD